MTLKSYAGTVLRAFLGTILISYGASSQNNNTAKLQPTEVVYYSLKAMAENPTAPRLPTIKQYFDRLNTENLNEKQEYALGEVYFLNLKPRESLAQYEKFMGDDDMRARIAWQKVMQINFAARDLHEKVEGMIEDYWQKFTPVPQDIWHVDKQIKNLATKYAREGNHQKVVDIITREVNRLPTNAPYKSLSLPAAFLSSFVAVGKEKEAKDMLRKSVVTMRQGLADLVSEQKADICIFQRTPPNSNTYFRLEEGLAGAPFEPNYPTVGLRALQYIRLIAEIELVL